MHQHGTNRYIALPAGLPFLTLHNSSTTRYSSTSRDMRLPELLQHKADALVVSRDAQLPEQYRIQPHSIPQNPSRLVYTCGLLSVREQEIVSLDATELAERVARKEYTAVEVTKAYIGAATIVHSATNCLTWLDAERALQQAEELDRQMAEGGPVGPLHGVPISAKGEQG